MTERDTFEVRFEAAVRGYAGIVSSDLDPAELAHRIAVAEPRRHGLAAVLTGRLGANPLRTVWVVFLVAALLALVAGTLAVGARLLESREPLPERPPAPLEEKTPGSTPAATVPSRVVNDGVRHISSTDALDVVAGYDGAIWLLREQGLQRLGNDGLSEWPEGSGPKSHVLQVAPDGTLWLIPRRSAFSIERRGEGLRSTDGEAWSSQACAQYPCGGVTVAPDGTLWASWYDWSACNAYTVEDCGDGLVGYLGPTGWQRLDGSTPADIVERLIFTDSGDVYGVVCPWHCLLYRYGGGAWQDVVYAPLVDVGSDGTVWQHGPSPSFPVDGLARFAGGAWEGWTSANLPEIKDGLGLDSQFKVAPDGGLWFSLWRIAGVGGPRVGDDWEWKVVAGADGASVMCDGVARFDGKVLDRFLPGQCISMDIAADGSVWVVAGDEEARDLYVITPTAVSR